MARGPVRGIGRVRRLMKRLPETTRGEVVVELHVTGRQMVSAVLAKTPKRRGNLQAGISSKVLPTSLRLQIGLLGTPAGRAKLFYGRIQDLGRKAQVVTVTRRATVLRVLGNNRQGNTRRSIYAAGIYKMRVRAMAPKRFVTGRYPELRSTLRGNLKGIFSRSLSAAAGGGGDE